MNNQRQCEQVADGLEEMDGNTPVLVLEIREKSKETAEAQLNKLFLARLDVRSRIAELNRNRAKLQARKIDVQSKITSLSQFDTKLMKREEEISRSLAES